MLKIPFRSADLPTPALSALLALVCAMAAPSVAVAQQPVRVGGTGSAVAAMARLGDAAATEDPGIRVRVLPSLGSALDHCRQRNEDTLFVIGGSKVYEAALPLANKLFITEIHRRVPGDTKFPDYDRRQWTEVAREDGPECSFVEYARR